jgi:predicted RNase H-like HicB family nuclease
MLREYIGAGLRAARYEILPDGSGFYGEIPGFPGVYANSQTLEECRNELEEVLEEWVLVRVSQNLDLPAACGIELKIRRVG